jgi:hypothetical protein
MAHLLFAPEWFFIYELIFALVYALITLAVSLYSFKVYRLSNQRHSKLFGVAFLLLSISYFIEFILSLSVLSEINETIMSVIDFQNIITLNNLSIFSHMLFFTMALVTLFYMILDVKSKVVYSALLFISVLFLLLAVDKVIFFFIFSSVLLIVISVDYLKNAINNKNKRTMLIVLAFVSLLIGHIHFIFSIANEIEYIIGSFFELTAYILILINLLKVLKNE